MTCTAILWSDCCKNTALALRNATEHRQCEIISAMAIWSYCNANTCLLLVRGPRGTQDRDKTATGPRVYPHRYPSPTQRTPSGPIVPGLLVSHIYKTNLILYITVFDHNSETNQIQRITLFKYRDGNIACLSINACAQEDICICIYIYTNEYNCICMITLRNIFL